MKVILVIYIVFFNVLCFAQKYDDHWIEVKGKVGFLAGHRPIMGHLAQEHAFATEVSYLFQPKGRKYWQQQFNNPIYGVTFFAGSVGNRELLGNYYGLFGTIRIPMITAKWYRFTLNLGAGLSHGTKRYNAETNILSMATSTLLNAHVMMGAESRFTFGRHAINLSIDMTHFSNGAFQVPNLGLNLPFLSLGYGYKIRENKADFEMIGPFIQRWEFGVIGYFSAKELFPIGGKKYPVMGLNFVGRRYFKQYCGMEASFDIMYKESVKAYQKDVIKSDAEIIQLGAFVGYILPFNKFHLVTGMGIYVRDKYQPQDLFYHRVGMRYVFDNGININLVLKSHWARADYIEYGIGYTFKR